MTGANRDEPHTVRLTGGSDSARGGPLGWTASLRLSSCRICDPLVSLWGAARWIAYLVLLATVDRSCS